MQGVENMLSSRLVQALIVKLKWVSTYNVRCYRKEAMLATLDLIREVYGSVEGYLNKMCMISQGDLLKIRNNLVVALPATIRLAN